MTIPIEERPTPGSRLRELDYSVVQQCMHCGLCLPTCPTYDATKLERNSPRGRIALMRAIADGRLEATKAFADEMYFCLGCLACMTACPAGVNYAELFEHARAEAEQGGVSELAQAQPDPRLSHCAGCSWTAPAASARPCHAALPTAWFANARPQKRRFEIAPEATARTGSHDAADPAQFSAELIAPVTPASARKNIVSPC